MFGATTCCISLTIPTASSPHRFACGLRPFDKLPSASSGQAGQALAPFDKLRAGFRLPLKGGVTSEELDRVRAVS